MEDIQGGFDGVLGFKCYDWDGTGEHDLIGAAEVSVRECSFGEMQVYFLVH
jgi:Ca2+-dependent lipid-binding protein